MRINHLIIGCRDVGTSAIFYINILGFKFSQDFVDTGTGKTGQILHHSHNGHDLDLLLVPFADTRLPSPQHLALEVDSKETFQRIYELAEKQGLKIRSAPALTSEQLGMGQLDIHNASYKNFYLLDPSGVNVEVMYK